MCGVVSGPVPKYVVSFRLGSTLAARIAVFGVIGAGLAGCASKSPPNYAGVDPRLVNERQWKVEIEDDGKPAQAPPARRMRPEEDDPSQPWSPNYGRKLPAQINPVQPPRQHAWPKPVEAAHRSRMDDQEADALMARAVNAHEMRRP